MFFSLAKLLYNKKISHISIVAVILSLSTLSQAYSADAILPSASYKYLPKLIKKLIPTVVSITTKSSKPINSTQQFGNNPFFKDFMEEFFGRRNFRNNQPQAKPQIGLGSGFIVSSDGYIITNNHVVKDSDEIKIILHNKKEYIAKIVGTNQYIDIALLKINAKKLLPYVKLGNSDKVEVGEQVIAIGNPFGLGDTVTTGIISAKTRSMADVPYSNFLQTDAAINKGNSGGPLFNMQGEVVGVNSSIYSTSGGGNIGIGFAIPVQSVKKTINDIKKYGHVKTGWIGILMENVNEEMALNLGMKEAKGVLVINVVKNGPASKANLLSGDVILKWNGKDINVGTDLQQKVANSKIGSISTVTILRNRVVKNIKIAVGQKDNDQADNSQKFLIKEMGIYGQNISKAIIKQYNINKQYYNKGVIVSKVLTPLGRGNATLKVGDVIIKINQNNIKSVNSLQKIIAKLVKSGRKSALVVYERVQGNMRTRYAVNFKLLIK